MSIEILKEEIRGNKLRNLYLFYGPEEYLKKHYTGSIENCILKDELKDFNKIVLEGKADLKKLVDTCETLPVFSNKKIVIIKDSGLFKSGKKTDSDKGKNKDKGSGLPEYLQSIPEYTCLVFLEDEIDKRVKTVDVIKKNGLIVEFPLQKPEELVKWVVKVFKSYKKDIDRTAASQLVDNCDEGMNDLLNEINKISSYVGDRGIVTEEDVEKVCTKSIKVKIFDLTDAISEKNVSKALKLLDDMISLKEPLPKVLFMIARQIRLLMEMKLSESEGLRLEAAAAKARITPYAAGKIQKQAKKFSIDKLKRVLNESLELDVAIKTGRINDRIAVELLINEFSKD